MLRRVFGQEWMVWADQIFAKKADAADSPVWRRRLRGDGRLQVDAGWSGSSAGRARGQLDRWPLVAYVGTDSVRGIAGSAEGLRLMVCFPRHEGCLSEGGSDKSRGCVCLTAVYTNHCLFMHHFECRRHVRPSTGTYSARGVILAYESCHW